MTQSPDKDDGVIYDRRKGKDYYDAIKEGYSVFTKDDIKLYNPNCYSVRKKVIMA